MLHKVTASSNGKTQNDLSPTEFAGGRAEVRGPREYQEEPGPGLFAMVTFTQARGR
jgi:hypothetical protein